MTKLYLTRMCRWGNVEDGHTYIGSVHTCPKLALLDGEYRGKLWRGGKYDPFVVEVEVDCIPDNVYLVESGNENKDGEYRFDIFCTDQKVTYNLSTLAKSRVLKFKVHNDMMYDLKEYHEDFHVFSDESQEYIKPITPNSFYEGKDNG